jgi:hypothetical protein
MLKLVTNLNGIVRKVQNCKVGCVNSIHVLSITYPVLLVVHHPFITDFGDD